MKQPCSPARHQPGGRSRPRAHRALHVAASVAAIALGAAAVAACQPAPPTVVTPGGTATTTTTTTAPPKPVAAAADEFNGPALDTAAWKAERSTYGNTGGGSRHCLTPQNVSVSAGTLRIRSSRGATTCPDGSVQPYSSGFIGSRGANRYFPLEGTFAVRARIPAAQGIWPAFWLRHRNGASVAEVDIMESFHSQVPGQASQALHLDGQVNTSHRSTWFETPSASPGWHEFAVRITRVDGDRGGALDDVRFDFSIDGKATLAFTDLNPAWLRASDPAATWDIALNTAVDGTWAGDPDGALGQLDQLGRCSLSGTYPSCSIDGLRRVDWTSPVVFEVDWVRFTPR